VADTDRELMDLAAKAAGAKMTDYSDNTPDHWIFPNAHGYWVRWSPLEDDGDALRLAVKLGLKVEIYSRRMEPFTRVPVVIGGVEEEHRDNPFKATRRAIVRAAAEIGRAM
jgi:hypothetical protein